MSNDEFQKWTDWLFPIFEIIWNNLVCRLATRVLRAGYEFCLWTLNRRFTHNFSNRIYKITDIVISTHKTENRISSFYPSNIFWYSISNNMVPDLCNVCRELLRNYAISCLREIYLRYWKRKLKIPPYYFMNFAS